MRKVIFQIMVTLDGFYEGPNHEIDWHNVDEEFNDYTIELLNNLDYLIFGRISYELMASYWPSIAAMNSDPIVAHKMNTLSKIVFSKSLSTVKWKNTRLIKDNIAEEIAKLKQQQGKSMAIFGSSDLALTFIELGLIDEYRIFINPLVQGNGKSLFKGIGSKFHLKLLSVRTFNSGNVLITYGPENN